ncbi:LysR family transcriptional regulator [Franconibacter pulveris 1160]|jgi:DNA-binding transcriptional LysR family regulator|uniref:LysR family transcriptional regulator n=1 Tax=Franconibacter TaxID=1649295 RepID=UPI00046398EB|nr:MULTISPECIES: LysR family transcriptional regulator [Franconibacter]MCK1970345.1 LysR family transcriptional regulator [Franconibacter sp. IITDAS19]MEB5923956.1 LysR family transcriptional regulator [Franconibacter daqui]GGD35403.1 LysR family transcriptional regulator [Franconibacter daqui]
MTIKENDFRKIDLNLLIAFAVLFREQSVSLAADKLHLGQPAVSGALSRLREMFDDPLFVRSGHRMQPTARAQALHSELMPLLEQLQSALFQQAEFHPQQANATITLGMTDWVEMWLMPQLIPALRDAAPGLRLNVVASDPFTDAQRLEGGELDMAISVAQASARWQEREALTQMPFVTLWHPEQITLNAPLSLESYAAHPHLLVTYREASSSQIDTLLAKQGRRRTVCYTTPHFAALPGLLRQMPALATVPAGLSENWQRSWGLAASPVPLDVPCIEVAMLWHQRHNSDPALMWLREFIRQRFG